MKSFVWLTLLLLPFSAFSAPKSDLWAYWDQHSSDSTQTISHIEWQSFLNKYLISKGENTLIRYSNVSESDKQALKSYIKTSAQLDPLAYSKAEQYAYWVNLYNALTVDLILDAYPIKSITKLGGLFSFGPWGDEVININGKDLTLNDIEHRILRPIWNDPRTHYAVNCASLGCPNLQSQAFTANNTQALLEQAAQEFVNSKKGVNISNGRLELSSIYEWFIDDFGSQPQLLQHLESYRKEPITFKGKIKYDYDWSLNQAQ
ncbi:DUF547 domain-containing protein [Vibrio sp. T187]|uniref:DUF547 domain-containing protein n=1 Tax=Vibrio TaxID=662 RepID=UPI0010C999AF|nr:MULTISPECIES: DUF547 domain-containing protein [Vibrio]MBW3697200.1 DUF547 domain-containing protein [Vibrio sp. T187]